MGLGSVVKHLTADQGIASLNQTSHKLNYLKVYKFLELSFCITNYIYTQVGK